MSSYREENLGKWNSGPHFSDLGRGQNIRYGKERRQMRLYFFENRIVNQAVKVRWERI